MFCSPNLTTQLFKTALEDLPLEELLTRLAHQFKQSLPHCQVILLAYRPTPDHLPVLGVTTEFHPEIRHLMRALEQEASHCHEALQLSDEMRARIRCILGLETGSLLASPIRPTHDAPIELFLVGLFDCTEASPERAFDCAHLYELLFHLRGAALRQYSPSRVNTPLALNSDPTPTHHHEALNLGAALTTALNLDDLLRLILEVSAKITNAHQGTIYLIEGLEATRSFTFHRRQTSLPCSYLYLPVTRHHRIKALLTLDHTGGCLSEDALQSLHHFTNQAAMAIENAQIFEWEQERAREATALYQAARTIEEAHELDDILSTATQVFASLSGLDRCIILLKDTRKSFLAVASASGLSADQEEFLATYRLPLADLPPKNKKALLLGKPLVFQSSPDPDSGFLSLTHLLPSYSCLILPLKAQEKLLGLLFLDSSKGAHHFSSADVRQLLTLSLQVANAIQRASLIQKLQENLGPLKALYQVSTAITGTLSLPRVIRLIVDQAVELLDYVSCALLVLDETGESFRIETSGPDHEAFRQPSFQARMARQAVESRRAHAQYLDQDSPQDPILKELAVHGFGGLLSVPLVAKKKMVGVLNCFVPPKIRFRQQEIRLIKGFANQAAIAVDNARLHGMIRFKMNELGTLFEVSKAVTSTLQLSKVLEEIVYHVRAILGAKACVLMLKEGSYLVLKAIKGLEPHQHEQRIAIGEGPAGIAAKTGQTLVFHADHQPFPMTDKESSIETALCVPIKTRGHIIGLLNVYYLESVEHTPAQLSLLSTLCAQAAVAIENARLFADKEQVTELLRKVLIPGEEMQFKGLTLGHRFIPSQDLSGDYYDLIPLGPHKCAFVIADVSGKGPEAAIQTVRAKHVIRSYAIAGYRPARILEMLNHHVQATTSELTRAVTVFYAEADLKTRTLRYACAGHEQPLYWASPHSEPKLLSADGIMIGACEDALYEERSLTIDPHAWLLLYTDGLTEARSPSGEFFGLERIIELVQEHEGQSAQRLVNRIYSKIRKFTREMISDDFSLLCVHF